MNNPPKHYTLVQFSACRDCKWIREKNKCIWSEGKLWHCSKFDFSMSDNESDKYICKMFEEDYSEP